MTVALERGQPGEDTPVDDHRDTHRVEISGKDCSFDVTEDQTVLDAALRANEWIPHSCTQGTCGTCKLSVLCGEVDHGAAPEYTLTLDERAQGLALACMARPRSDLVVTSLGEIDDGIPRHALRDHSATVVTLEDIATDTRRLVLELDEDLSFNAGQYCELIVPGTGIGRQYSMANPPTDTRRMEFHVKRTPGGLATDGWIFSSLTVGDELALRGPLGQFSLVREQSEPVILIGGGTGLAPLKSIAVHALDNRLVPEMHLYHGGRRRADLYDVDFFTALAERHSNFRYRPVLSEQQWDGATGMVTDAVVDDFTSCRGMSAYLCGPPPMVEAGVKALKRRRMAPRLIFREEFVVAPIAP